MTETPAVTVTATRYTVSCLPENAPDADLFTIEVVYRGNGRWAVQRGESRFLGADGTWSHAGSWAGATEPTTEAEMDTYHRREDAWMADHRFDLDTALKLAREAAPHISFGRYKVTDALALRAKEQQ